MTNTINLTNPNHFSRSTIVSNALNARNQAQRSFRIFIASSLFLLASMFNMPGNLSQVFAKSKLVGKVKEIKAKGQFKLLNIYERMMAEKPALMKELNNRKEGLASWYGGMFHGKKTAMGTTYNMYEMTAAHRTLPLGTLLRVTNASNGESCVVKVTDRGPYVANRVLDLSYAAAKKLGYADHGTANVKLEILSGSAMASNEATQTEAVTSVASESVDSNATLSMNTAIQQDSVRIAGVEPNGDMASVAVDVASILPTGMVANLFASIFG